MSVGIFTAWTALTSVRSREGRVGGEVEQRGSPPRENGRPGLPIAARHMVGRPRSQSAQAPQLARVDRATWSPGATCVTPAPTASTTPAPSWPSTTGTGNGIVPSIDGQVAVAQPGGGDAHQHLAGARSRTSRSSTTCGRSPSKNDASHGASLPHLALGPQEGQTTDWSSLYACRPNEPPSRPTPLLLEAAERRLGVALDRVDADVAAAQPGGQGPGAARVGAEDVVVEAVRGAVGDPHRLLLVVEGQGDDDRAEQLLAGHGHAGVDVGDERRRDVEAGRRSGGACHRPRRCGRPARRAPAMYASTRSRWAAEISGPDDRGVIHRVPDGQCGAYCECGDDLARTAIDGRARASAPCRSGRCGRTRSNRPPRPPTSTTRFVGIPKHDGRTLAAQFHQGALHRLGRRTSAILFPTAVDPVKLTMSTSGVRDQRLAGRAPEPVTTLKTPVRQPGLLEQRAQLQAAQRVLRGRLGDDRIAHGERGRDLAREIDEGKVVGGDASDDTHGAADGRRADQPAGRERAGARRAEGRAGRCPAPGRRARSGGSGRRRWALAWPRRPAGWRPSRPGARGTRSGPRSVSRSATRSSTAGALPGLGARPASYAARAARTAASTSASSPRVPGRRSPRSPG